MRYSSGMHMMCAGVGFAERADLVNVNARPETACLIDIRIVHRRNRILRVKAINSKTRLSRVLTVCKSYAGTYPLASNCHWTQRSTWEHLRLGRSIA